MTGLWSSVTCRNNRTELATPTPDSDPFLPETVPSSTQLKQHNSFLQKVTSTMASQFQLFSSLRYDPALLEVPESGFQHAGWNHKNHSPFYMLDFHRDRILRAATHWGWDKVIEVLRGDDGLTRLEEFLLRKVGPDQKSPMRVRVILSREGELGCELSSTPELGLRNLFPSNLPAPGESIAQDEGLLPLRDPSYEVVLDSVKTAQSEFTHFKTTNRPMYDSARQRAHITLTDHKECLLVNESDGLVMEGTVTTPYFWRDGKWVTPSVGERFQPGSGSGGQDGTSRRWMLESGLAIEAEIPADSVVDGEECWLSNGVRGFMFGRIKKST